MTVVAEKFCWAKSLFLEGDKQRLQGILLEEQISADQTHIAARKQKSLSSTVYTGVPPMNPASRDP